MKFAVCGATGMVGRVLMYLLAEDRWREHEVVAYATGAGDRVVIRGGLTPLNVLPLPGKPPAGVDYAFTALPGDVSRDLVPRWRDAGIRVVDKSSVFRMKDDVPLVVPGVNDEAVSADVRLIATPNCTTIPVALALHPLRDFAGITDVRVASYQAVSGAGRAAVDAWKAEIALDCDGEPPFADPIEGSPFTAPIHGNVIPRIGSIDEDGHATEELKLMRELPKILNQPDLPVSCTSVRVPVEVGHGAAVEVGFDRPVDLAEVVRCWRDALYVDYWQDPAHPPTALDADGRDDVLIGRLRRAAHRDHALLFWVVGDNLRVGAATNGLRIVERWTRVSAG